jgi:putative heme iron utilization protein
VREKVYGDAGADALFIASEKYFFERRKTTTVHVENDFVHHAIGKQPGQGSETLGFRQAFDDLETERRALAKAVGKDCRSPRVADQN